MLIHFKGSENILSSISETVVENRDGDWTSQSLLESSLKLWRAMAVTVLSGALVPRTVLAAPT